MKGKPYRFHRKAETEFTSAAEHYRAISEALGQRFYLTIDGLLNEICAAPTLFRMILPPARRHFRLPFPYAVIYIDRPDQVWIIAVSPFKREPGYWRDRLG
ncbi:MAG TPA: type II toxin-antitoxin system RelE/ParE family toxin [Opitutaceae bacterium]|nr:type II toxin-antitoxin system RelE/ParE family toxin [Opitutaceae bacterium]